MADVFLRFRGRDDGATATAREVRAAVEQTGLTAKEAALQQVKASIQKQEKLKQEILAYREVAAAAQRGSREEITATRMAERAQRELTSSISTTRRDLRELGSTAHRAGSEISRMERGALAGSGIFRGMGRQIAFASSAFIGTFGLVHGIKTSIDAGADLEKQLARTNHVFGTSAKVIIAWSKDTVRSLGLSDAEALKFAGSIGIMLTNLGVAPAKAAALSKSLAQLAVDIAAVRGTDPEQALNAITAALGGRTRALKLYGIQINETQIKEEALRLKLVQAKGDMTQITLAQHGLTIARANEAKVLADSGRGSSQALAAHDAITRAQLALNKAVEGAVPGLTNQQRALAIVALVEAAAAKQHGYFGAHTALLSEKTRILHAALQNLEANIGGALAPAVAAVTTKVTDWISKSENQAKVTHAVEGAVDKLTKAAKIIWPIITNVADASDKVAKAFGGWNNAIKIFLGFAVANKIGGLTRSFGGLAGRGGIGSATTALTGRGGLLAALGRIPSLITITVDVVLTGAALGLFTGKKVTPIIEKALGLTDKQLFTKDLGKQIADISTSPTTGKAVSPQQGLVERARTTGQPFEDVVSEYAQSMARTAVYWGYDIAKNKQDLFGKLKAAGVEPALAIRIISFAEYWQARMLKGLPTPDRVIHGTTPAPDTTYSKPPAGHHADATTQAPSPSKYRAVFAPGADRPGAATENRARIFATDLAGAAGENLTVGTGTAHSQYVKGEPGVQSEHWTGNAIDIPATGDELLRLGRTALILAGADPAWANKQTGGVFNINGYNILFNTNVGGNHFNHLHVGVGHAKSDIPPGLQRFFNQGKTPKGAASAASAGAPGVRTPASAAHTAATKGSAAGLISKFAPGYGLDAAAVLAVAAQEGLSGQPGDYGRFVGKKFVALEVDTPGGSYTSFGPFQLHAGSTLPAAVWAKGPAYAQRWANSPVGIRYALDLIASKARGLQGRAAIEAIVRKFERPAKANVEAEIEAAVAAYGGTDTASVTVGTKKKKAAVAKLVTPQLATRLETARQEVSQARDKSDFEQTKALEDEIAALGAVKHALEKLKIGAGPKKLAEIAKALSPIESDLATARKALKTINDEGLKTLAAARAHLTTVSAIVKLKTDLGQRVTAADYRRILAMPEDAAKKLEASLTASVKKMGTDLKAALDEAHAELASLAGLPDEITVELHDKFGRVIGVETIAELRRQIGKLLAVLADPAASAKLKAAAAKTISGAEDAIREAVSNAAQGVTNTSGELLGALSGLADDITVEIPDRFGRVATVSVAALRQMIAKWAAVLADPAASAKLKQAAAQALAGLVPAVTDAVNAAETAAQAAWQVAHDAAVATAQSVVDGIQAEVDAAQGVVNKAQQVADQARSRFEADLNRAFDLGLQVFDARTQEMLDNLKAQVEVSVNGILEKFTIGEGDLTPAEQALQDLQKKSQQADLQHNLLMAQAQADPGAIAAARLAIAEDALQTQAQAERKAADDALAQQKKDLSQKRAVLRDNLELERQDILDAFEQGKIDAKDAQDKIIALLGRYGVDYAAAGHLLGAMFEGELHDAFDRVATDAQVYQQALGELQTATDALTAAMAALAASVKALDGLKAQIEIKTKYKYETEGSPGGDGGPVYGRPDAGEQQRLIQGDVGSSATSSTSGLHTVSGYGFQHGGKVPGQYVGKEDTVPALLTPGETVIDRSLTKALEKIVTTSGGVRMGIAPIPERGFAAGGLVLRGAVLRPGGRIDRDPHFQIGGKLLPTGLVPGFRTGRDSEVVRVAPGELILNEAQQGVVASKLTQGGLNVQVNIPNAVLLGRHREIADEIGRLAEPAIRRRIVSMVQM